MHTRRYTRDDVGMRPRLRVYTGEDDAGGIALETPTIRISFGELTRIVADAGRIDCAWLSDFEHDEITIPEDLYEVLTAYWRLRPGA